jgi:GNAT superfamily N-acetyltransferase
MSGPASPIVEVSDDPPQEAYLQLWEVLKAFNIKAMGDCESKTFAILLRDPETRAVIGGLWGRSLWGSFYVDMLVAPDGQRGAGLGGDMLRKAEAEARARGCGDIWLDTFAFQARPFYEKLGFRVFGQIDGEHPAFPRYFMVKDLT